MAQQFPISPLIDIQTDAFVTQYQHGVWWSMHGDEQGQGPVADTYLVSNLQSYVARGYFDGQHDSWLPHLGFFLGMYHGGVLSPETGQLRPDVTTLAVLTNAHARDGYSAGREGFFTEMDPHERRYSETTLLQQFSEVALEVPFWKEAQRVWFFYVGCLLGELSGHLFPMTEDEHLHWTQVNQSYQQDVSTRYKVSQERTTEPLPVVVPQEA